MAKFDLPVLAWLILLAAAILEVGGDGVIRLCVRGRTWWAVPLGCLLLAGYGLIDNLVRWDFSRLLGVYVGAFALVSLLFGLLLFKKSIAPATWVGLALIIAGGLVIQFGAE